MVHKSVQLSHSRKFLRSLVLKSRVRPAGRDPPPAECVKQMTDVLACWKKSAFDDQQCLKEIALFKSCADEVYRNSFHKKPKTGHRTRGGQYYWHHEEVNARLSKFSKPQ